MMSTGILHYFQNLFRFSTQKIDDLRVSDELVNQLKIPDETKRFVFAIREPESKSVIYILCAQNLSKKSSIDAEVLIRSVKPGAVVAQVKDFQFDDDLIPLTNGNGRNGDKGIIPISSLEVIKRSFLHKISKDKYENIAGSLVLKEIFGVGFNGHFVTAKKVAEEIGCSFMLIESPFVKLETESDSSDSSRKFLRFGLQGNNLIQMKLGAIVMAPSTSSRYLIHSEDFLHSQMMKSLCSHLVQLSLLDQNTNTARVDVNVQPKDGYEAPQYARSVYGLLEDLHDIFQEIPSMKRALGYSQKLLDDVSKGDEKIDGGILSEIYGFRIAVEGLRIAFNDAGRKPVRNGERKSSKTEFSELPYDEKAHALLAHAIRSQTKDYDSIVAVLDASTLSGLRRHWNTAVPPDFKNTVEELVDDSAADPTANHSGDQKRRLKDKPVVAMGAGATAVLGASSLSKVVPASTLVKVVTFKIPVSLKLVMTQTQKLVSISISKFMGPSKIMVFNSGVNSSSSMKAAASAEKIRTVVHSVIASAEKTSLSAMRSAFYEIMRKRRVRPIGVLPWATFGCSVATCASLLVYGDGIECAVESVPAAPSIASLGRGIERLQRASQNVEQMESSRIQNSIEALVNKFKKWKLAP